MLKVERQKIILDELRTHNKVRSSFLCKNLHVSEDTIRRDLDELQRKGLLKKVHGGATSTSYILSFSKQEIEEIGLKQILAKKSLDLIHDGQVIIIDGGTTNLQLVNILPLDMYLTIYTNSIPIASKLCDYKNIDSIFLGGSIYAKGQTTVGIKVLDAMNEVRADMCFVGVTGIDNMAGLTEGNRMETVIKKAIMSASRTSVVMVISQKLGSVQPFKVCDINCVDIMVTELDPEDEVLALYVDRGIKML